MVRPHTFTPEIGAEICRRMSEGETIYSICKDEGMPPRGTVYRWVADTEKEELAEFRKAYAAATMAQALAMADDCVAISDESSQDTIVDENGNERVNHEVLGRSRLRVETRMKLMAKKAPSMFGDSMALTGAGGGPIVTKEISGRELGRRLAFVLASGMLEAPKDEHGDGEP